MVGTGGAIDGANGQS